jgi:signal peptidase I
MPLARKFLKVKFPSQHNLFILNNFALMMWLILIALISLFLSFSILICILAPYYLCVITVKSYSMIPTLRDGDRVLVLRHWPSKWLRKGQIVIAWHTPSELQYCDWPRKASFIPYIKRITALPGDTVVTEFKKLNKALQELLLCQFDGNGKKVQYVQNGYVFLESDNPAGGIDSHCWGPISMDGVLGVVILKLTSVSSNDKPIVEK